MIDRFDRALGAAIWLGAAITTAGAALMVIM